MNKTNITIVIVSICCLLFSGCFFLVVGVGALGGYAISNDTIQGETAKTFNSVWASAQNVLSTMGNIVTEYKKNGEIEADISPSYVKLKVEEITPKAVRLRVSARRYMLPNISLAQKIYIKIIEKAK
ncbi:DUF3568 family protein [Candidatus Omnitrophota bacterium]